SPMSRTGGGSPTSAGSRPPTGRSTGWRPRTRCPSMVELEMAAFSAQPARDPDRPAGSIRLASDDSVAAQRKVTHVPAHHLLWTPGRPHRLRRVLPHGA